VTEVVIDGDIFRFDLNNRDIMDFIRYYQDFLNYKSRQQQRRYHGNHHYSDVVATTTHR
jgi:hypothetical protein